MVASSPGDLPQCRGTILVGKSLTVLAFQIAYFPGDFVQRGRSQVHRKSWTLVAQPYAKGVCKVLGRALLILGGLIKQIQNFDPASCARCSSNARSSKPRTSPSRADSFGGGSACSGQDSCLGGAQQLMNGQTSCCRALGS